MLSRMNLMFLIAAAARLTSALGPQTSTGQGSDNPCVDIGIAFSAVIGAGLLLLLVACLCSCRRRDSQAAETVHLLSVRNPVSQDPDYNPCP